MRDSVDSSSLETPTFCSAKIFPNSPVFTLTGGCITVYAYKPYFQISFSIWTFINERYLGWVALLHKYDIRFTMPAKQTHIYAFPACSLTQGWTRKYFSIGDFSHWNTKIKISNHSKCEFKFESCYVETLCCWNEPIIMFDNKHSFRSRDYYSRILCSRTYIENLFDSLSFIRYGNLDFFAGARIYIWYDWSTRNILLNVTNVTGECMFKVNKVDFPLTMGEVWRYHIMKMMIVFVRRTCCPCFIVTFHTTRTLQYAWDWYGMVALRYYLWKPGSLQPSNSLHCQRQTCYSVHHIKKDPRANFLNETNTKCHTMGGKVLTINSFEEYDFILDLLRMYLSEQTWCDYPTKLLLLNTVEGSRLDFHHFFWVC